jgi:hypothetical protein
MHDVKLCLLQKPGSPLTESLLPCLASQGGPLLAASDIQGLTRLPERALLLWDLNGFAVEETDEIINSLPSSRFGVVMVAAAMDGFVLRVCRLAGALGLLVEPFSAVQVRATLEVALACQGRVWELVDQIATLQKEKESRPLVEEAKRVIMEVGGVSEPEAMRMLQRYSRTHNQKLAETARRVLEAFRLMKSEK